MGAAAIQPFNADFYATAATVIPVLFLALMLPGGILYRCGVWAGKSTQRHTESFLIAVLIVVLIFGVLAEICALVALYRRSATRFEGDITIKVVIGLPILVGLLVVVAMGVDVGGGSSKAHKPNSQAPDPTTPEV